MFTKLKDAVKRLCQLSQRLGKAVKSNTHMSTGQENKSFFCFMLSGPFSEIFACSMIILNEHFNFLYKCKIEPTYLGTVKRMLNRSLSSTAIETLTYNLKPF